MAIGIENFSEKDAADSDFPNGSIKNDTGAEDGTPANKETVNDIYMFFDKLMRTAELTANGLFDSEYNGYQYMQALKAVMGRHHDILYRSGLAASISLTPRRSPLLQFTPGALNGWTVSLDIVDDEEDDRGYVTVHNASPFTVSVVSASSWPVNFNSAGYNLTAGSTKTFMFDGRNGPQWLICG